MALQQLVPRDPIFAEAQTPQLQIESWSNSARTLLVRGYTADALISFNHLTNGDRSQASDIIDIPAVPQSLQVSPETAPVRRGECYVRVTLLMGGFPVGVLSSCYLTDSKTISYPPGQFESWTDGEGLIRAVNIANPAAGAEISTSVPTNTRWQLLGARFVLTCDANAANRRVTLIIDDGTNETLADSAGALQTANQARNYSFADGIPADTGFIGAELRVAIPTTLKLFQAWRIRTSTAALQVGDQFSSIYLVVMEWIEE